MSAVLIPHPAVSRHAFRAQVCRLVDRLITMLDEIDGDADLEDGGDDEPGLAHPEVSPWSSQVVSAAWLPLGSPGWTDLEEACEDEGAVTGDDEPEVGV